MEVTRLCRWLGEEIGDWGGKIAEASLPDYFEVDYVPVYQEE
jgi:hypothetical protein